MKASGGDAGAPSKDTFPHTLSEGFLETGWGHPPSAIPVEVAGPRRWDAARGVTG